MRKLVWFSCLFAFVGAMMLPPSSDATKKKDKQTVPVKIIKASDTKFKHAKIVETEKKVKKKKGFLWFKKKEPKVLSPKIFPRKQTEKAKPRKSELVVPAEE